MTLLLSNEEVDGLLQMPDCIDAMEDAFRAFGGEQKIRALAHKPGAFHQHVRQVVRHNALDLSGQIAGC